VTTGGRGNEVQALEFSGHGPVLQVPWSERALRQTPSLAGNRPLYWLTLDHEISKNAAPAYNIAPTVDVPFVAAVVAGGQRLREGRWWLVPWWAKEMPKAAMFNAGIETVDTGNAFKDAFRTTRCLIPVDGFYEWTISPADGGKDPWHIHLPDRRPTLAGTAEIIARMAT
jgi:putative SOS response-associated peptidase YedK